jgi:phage terminase large subunit
MEVTPVFTRNRATDKKIVVNRGGTRSSKTYSIAQLCALWLITGEIGKGNYIHKGVWSTVRKHQTTLEKTVVRDFEEILQNEDWYGLVSHNKTKKTYSYKGRLVEFFGADDQQKLRGAKRNILYCNEANELEYRQEFFQLLMRTTDKIFIDFNPDDEDIWINTELEQKRTNDKGDVETIVSTYKDNTFLPESLVDEIEYLQQTDPEFWKIYGLGEYGNITGLIYENVTFIPAIPENAKFVCYGLDFGFTNDPTAVIEIWKHDKDIYLNEMIYENGLTNEDIANRLKELGVTRQQEVICDSAEPKSIEELYRQGINSKPAKKGPDSIKNGIDILKRYNINVTNNSTNLRKEFRSYKWAVDRTGNSTGKPIDKFNHAMDAVRYGAIIHLAKHNTGKYNIL